MGTVRPYAGDDAEDCSLVVNAALDGMEGLNEAARDDLFARSSPQRLGAELRMYHAVVYEQDGEVVGVGALDGPEVKRLYVSPAAQGRGVGAALLGALEDEARDLGFDRLVLDASPSSVGFWERMGYAPVRSGTARWDEAEFEYVHMVKELAPD